MRHGRVRTYSHDITVVVIIGGLHLGFMGETMTGMLAGKIRGIFFLFDTVRFIMDSWATEVVVVGYVHGHVSEPVVWGMGICRNPFQPCTRGLEGRRPNT